MHVLVMGMGHVGKALAGRLRAEGHTVSGTTTTPAKVDDLKQHADHVVVLKGDEADKVAAAAQGVDAIVVTVAPNIKKTRTKEEREVEYHQVLQKSCESAAAACERVVFLSSFSVYGTGGEGDEPITEDTPTANHDEPSSKYYQAAERAVLTANQGCVLRFPDMYGAPGDMDFAARVKMAHEYFGGKVIFGADAPLYTIHFEDVVQAVWHALDASLKGVYNVCDNDNLPATNKTVFDALTDAQGLSRLEYLDQIQAPNRRISAQRIYDTGYRVQHADPHADLLDKTA